MLMIDFSWLCRNLRRVLESLVNAEFANGWLYNAEWAADNFQGNQYFRRKWQIRFEHR